MSTMCWRESSAVARTFEITTSNLHSVSRLGFWPAMSSGAIDVGFVAASITTWYCANDLPALLGWAIGATVATTLGISSLLRWKMKA